MVGSISRQQVEQVVRRYLDATTRNEVASRAELFASDAVYEDPVGSAPCRGREAIRKVFEGHTQFQTETRLEFLVVSGNEAAYVFTATVVDSNADTATIRTVETLRCDADGQIVSMRAYFDSTSIG